MVNIPVDLWLDIFQNLPGAELTSKKIVCHEWKTIIEQNYYLLPKHFVPGKFWLYASDYKKGKLIRNKIVSKKDGKIEIYTKRILFETFHLNLHSDLFDTAKRNLKIVCEVCCFYNFLSLVHLPPKFFEAGLNFIALF
jgi:hypothetical protein